MASKKQATLGDLLRESRRSAGKSIKEAGRDLGVSYTYISKLENGRVHPSSETLERIANYYRADSDALYAAAGKVPSDIQRLIEQHPSKIFALIRKHAGNG